MGGGDGRGHPHDVHDSVGSDGTVTSARNASALPRPISQGTEKLKYRGRMVRWLSEVVAKPRGFESPTPSNVVKEPKAMKYSELEKKAKAYLEAFPEQTPVQIYINGFLAGYKQSSSEEHEDEATLEKKDVLLSKIDYTSIRASWAVNCPAYTEVRSMSEKRKEKIRSRWREFSELGDPIDVCRELFKKVQASDFLRGGNSRGWKATFDWLFENSNNWVKVYEGQYDNRASGARGGKTVNDYWG